MSYSQNQWLHVLARHFPRVSTHPNVAMIKMTSALLFPSRDRICALVFVATSSALQDTPAVAFPVVPPVNALFCTGCQSRSEQDDHASCHSQIVCSVSSGGRCALAYA